MACLDSHRDDANAGLIGKRNTTIRVVMLAWPLVQWSCTTDTHEQGERGMEGRPLHPLALANSFTKPTIRLRKNRKSRMYGTTISRMMPLLSPYDGLLATEHPALVLAAFHRGFAHGTALRKRIRWQDQEQEQQQREPALHDAKVAQ